ncbi:hypothetical protein KAFR_0A06850 [Kazachstania africana CBS 2517]|uniref:Transcription factor Iwr1 domain-containing protein n=1 Tax=Kazachstania africana (strain ATCC 22294 / BCRC 22015 / CBS 2517 / CECT 1963 / NBRC 1671 / NRRL Y-8276) TaxID=1071382 RepID=H2AP20_KAZAF|nr:hypothetical protein KAFR_0A06850 [Kazachstania africana CBS 2517]CCF56120.1 hypothetical protein KAFR_0A06850 [Kazachstania africana CBS 2517]
MTTAPEFIRVKRRRDEDSVQALLIDEEVKSKKAKFVFKLTKTVYQQSYEKEEESYTPLLKLSNDNSGNKHFVLEQHAKKRKRRDSNEQTNSLNEEELPPEITAMVSEYLKINNESSDTVQRKKPSKKHYSSQVANLPSLDYVYDIYHLEKISDNEPFNNTANVGFVKILNKDIDLLPDESDEENDDFLSDEEDSNDENYYQNDYPEDEDDDRSILFGSEGEEIASENGEVSPWPKLPEETPEEINTYQELFEKFEQSQDILQSLNSAHVIDLDMMKESYNDEDEDRDELVESGDYDTNENTDVYERNDFFPTDEDDPLAQHRDRIFAQLKKMIDKE